MIGCGIETPPVSLQARRELGRLIRRVQHGAFVEYPASSPMPDIGSHCHEFRVGEANGTWRAIYRIDDDAVVIVEVFFKTTRKTPQWAIDNSKRRLKWYDANKRI